MKIKCEGCNGTGIREKNISGWEGEPEQDVEVVCSECDGTGEVEEDVTFQIQIYDLKTI